ncbi:hypothetical protein B0H13DRAFT_1883739 [Mycena leptocephala]|nr:hypothetical protein B0H13DRAFT_1883739 [Mycena leptocephala]
MDRKPTLSRNSGAREGAKSKKKQQNNENTIDDGADADGNTAGSDSETFGDNPRDGSYNPDELNEEDQDDDISGSEGDIDEELDEAVTRVIPTVNISIPPKVNIKFEVPYKIGTRDLTGITSRIGFDDFLVAVQVAERMKTRVGVLNIGYIPSYNKTSTPKPAPKLLEDDDSWDALCRTSPHKNLETMCGLGHQTVRNRKKIQPNGTSVLNP